MSLNIDLPEVASHQQIARFYEENGTEYVEVKFTGSKDAPELAYRAFRIIHIDDGISCGQPIQRLVRQRQYGTITLMCSDPVANAGCVRVFP